jgi:tetratricopeptide (TPR) repeat protein
VLFAGLALSSLLGLAIGQRAVASDLQSISVAIDKQRERVARNPQRADLHNDLANLLTLAGRSDEAVEVYERALELDPGSFEAHFNIGLLQLAQGRRGAAERHLREAIKIYPSSAWAHYQLGELQRQNGNRRQAISSYARAFDLDTRLAFADVNPQVIANPYATEALLRSRTERRTVEAAPRAYSDPLRLQRDLLGRPVAEDMAQGTTPEDAALEDDPDGPQMRTLQAGSGAQSDDGDLTLEEPGGQDQPPVPGAAPTQPGAAPGAPAATAAPDLPGRVRVPRRTIGPQDLRGGGAGGRRPEGDDGDAGDRGGGRFRPGRRSSASLELRLVERPLLIATAHRGRVSRPLTSSVGAP